MVNTKLTIHIKTDAKGENIDFFYKRKDITLLTDTNEKLLVMYVEQLVRGVVDNGFGLAEMKKAQDGKDISK